MRGRSFDVVIAGGGHNALVAATLLARAGRSVVVLERRDELGGAAVSAAPFRGFDVRLSRYSYLVSLFPPALLRSLGVSTEIRPRRVAAHRRFERPPAFQAMLARIAERIFPTLTEPLRSREEFRRLLVDDVAWNAVFEAPLSELIERTFDSDLTRGTVLTDALIGTFAPADDPLLRQNRCFLYHNRRRQLERAGRRDGRAVGRAVGCRARGRRGARDRRRGRLDRHRRNDRRGDLRRRTNLCGAARARRRRPGRPRRDAGRAGRATGGRPAQDQHAAEAPAARAGSRLGGGVHRHVPRQRGLRAARGGIRRGLGTVAFPPSLHARSTATR